MTKRHVIEQHGVNGWKPIDVGVTFKKRKHAVKALGIRPAGCSRDGNRPLRSSAVPRGTG